MVGIVFIFSLFDFRFVMWAFPELSIFEAGRQIRDRCDFSFVGFIWVSVLGFSEDIFGQWQEYFLLYPIVSFHLSALLSVILGSISQSLLC